jgi:hypothetical protein
MGVEKGEWKFFRFPCPAGHGRTDEQTRYGLCGGYKKTPSTDVLFYMHTISQTNNFVTKEA